MNKTSRNTASPVGLISVLVVLASLCLCIFAFLCALSAASSYKIGAASTDSFMAYYRADTEAEEILASLRAGEKPSEVAFEEDGTACYTCPVSDQTELYVRVRLSGSDYKVLTWKQRETGSWYVDTSLPVWTGD